MLRGFILLTFLGSGVLTTEEASNQGRSIELTVEECVRRALENNPDLAALEFVSEARKADIEASKGTFDPILAGGYSISSSRTKAGSFLVAGSGVSVAVQKNQTANVGVGQTLFTGGSYNLNFASTRRETNSGSTFTFFDPSISSSLELTFSQPLLRSAWTTYNKAGILGAKMGYQMAERDFDWALMDTIFQVHAAYWDLAFAIEDVKVKEEAVQLAMELLEINQKKVDEGVSAPVEVLQAETGIAIRNQELITARNQVQANEDTLKQLVFPFRNPEEWMLKILPSSVPPSPQEFEVPGWEAALQKAFTERPDLESLRIDLKAKELNLEVSENELLPGLTLDGTATNRGLAGFNSTVSPPDNTHFADATEEVFGSDFPSYSIGLNFEVPIGNRAAKGRHRAAQADLSAAKQNLRTKENAVAREVRDAIRQLHFVQEQIEATQKSRKLAQEQLEAEQRKFEVGLSTNFQVLEFQKELTEALSNEKLAILDFAKAVTNLSRAQGVLRP